MDTWFITLAAILLPLVIFVITIRRRQTHQREQKQFPFLELPQELRDMVYEYFLDDPVYPAPPRPSFHTPSVVSWMNPTRWTSSTPSRPHQRSNKCIFLANKQIHAEYMDMLCKRCTFKFFVSPETYKSLPPSPLPSSPSHPPPTTTIAIQEATNVWTISPATLSKIRHCSLSLITTSAMLGVTDPRSMTSSSWSLGRRMRQQLKHMSSIQTFTLDAKALGDPLWNPLWIWYHASQSLKLLGTDLSDTVPRGPQLSRITFSLDTWSPGENYLKRQTEGWTWYCARGHVVATDFGHDMTVREFCAKLYKECKVCWAVAEDEDLL
ncbi:hypothetical protein COCC4DRAFT_152777 [Bipolaris maydis ATCC 48331]|uniref:Uncharacterized protein n=2 Tax=Cochliobolus heterostrophus TaxID=5016 RepID=M2V3G4_COCH5|nr:uncharacterized protein COCC4DRAFT_152777 [Bipolaris maydis ATCC 48331]EMD94563.1 hypothetical protein COCHEDRAFT_1091077 [Bipolaris maydis C5]KAJ5029002.1 hypothetical protein J3E73DRAFT_183059 [Bipolaris maydis]ENH99648.1 hypothetical protein COCC4DRAFT_152777 [Bipolaris maydis ATCC 48331]KAJ6215256.1 hypothetical protein PSV09DRAFT_1091077 [Bipolaris maydis]KAJ6276378.1 hypothetical protein PSV08DRAFT_170036 [Bipolaris maydis]